MKNLKVNIGKLFILFSGFFLLLTDNSLAQMFYLGVNGGGGLQKVTYMRKEYRDQFKSKITLGGRAGVSLEVPLTNSFNLISDFDYAIRGRKVTPDENDWTMDESHYFLELPILLNLHREGEIKKIGPIKGIGRFDWFIGAGPNISYFLGGSGILKTYALESKYNISFGGKEGDYHYITFHNANRWQWGLDFQAGIVSHLRKGDQLMTSLRFTYGHTNLGPPDGSSMPILGFADNIAHNYKILNLTFTYLFDIDLMLFRKGKSTKGKIPRSKSLENPSYKGKDINKIKKRD